MLKPFLPPRRASEFGSAAAPWRPFPARESVTSSENSILTVSPTTRTRTASTPCEWRRYGWTSTRNCCTWIDRTCATIPISEMSLTGKCCAISWSANRSTGTCETCTRRSSFQTETFRTLDGSRPSAATISALTISSRTSTRLSTWESTAATNQTLRPHNSSPWPTTTFWERNVVAQRLTIGECFMLFASLSSSSSECRRHLVYFRNFRSCKSLFCIQICPNWDFAKQKLMIRNSSWRWELVRRHSTPVDASRILNILARFPRIQK